ncbi:MAG: hypothetical protein ABR503_10220, partial [Chitinophagaceae bacterium]
MKDFSQLKKNLKKDFSLLKKIKLAVLGDTATQFLMQAIRGAGYDHGLDLQTWEADFNQIERQVFDTNSELYQFEPEIIIVFQSSHKLLGKYNKLNTEKHCSLASAELDLIENIYSTLKNNLKTKIIYYNYTEIDDSVFGKKLFFQPSIYINTEMVLSIDVLPQLASKTIDLINAINGRFKKCVVLDLDNTIWGGVIGDDGLENIQLGSLGIGKAFSEFQY